MFVNRCRAGFCLKAPRTALSWRAIRAGSRCPSRCRNSHGANPRSLGGNPLVANHGQEEGERVTLDELVSRRAQLREANEPDAHPDERQVRWLLVAVLS